METWTRPRTCRPLLELLGALPGSLELPGQPKSMKVNVKSLLILTCSATPSNNSRFDFIGFE